MMRRSIALLCAALLCLPLAGCAKDAAGGDVPPESRVESHAPEVLPAAAEGSADDAAQNVPKMAEEAQGVDLTGPWCLDDQRNDLAAFAASADLFPGYGEWGARMEIRSDGTMSWYIGADGWQGTYAAQGNTLRAELVSDLEQTARSMDFRIVTGGGTPRLELDYANRTICWLPGDTEDAPAADEAA